MGIRIKKLTEADFQRQVMDLARVRGWRTAHFHRARTADGWITPVAGDGKGFPDLMLVRGNRLVFLELKVGRNKPTVEQRLWIDALGQAATAALVVYPEDWDAIDRVLM